ncbi:conserved hypothetical protein [Dehalogenimonas lykanthroporepellens BL-DC-9]|jgi:uncharacterized protein (TIGR00725 family)|nr:conserved hypothetical protein [Dehalogenimonas lykanthroporepellens BL-DC-9]
MSHLFIAVIGASKASAAELLLAEQVGREIGRHDAVLVCGGLEGIMEAACKGAAAEGGLTVGILPGEHRETANSYVKIPIVTGIGYARNAIVAKSGHAVIAIGGGYGTLSEIAYARQAGIPVIGLDTWNVSRSNSEDVHIIRAANPDEAVQLAISRALEKS